MKIYTRPLDLLPPKVFSLMDGFTTARPEWKDTLSSFAHNNKKDFWSAFQDVALHQCGEPPTETVLRNLQFLTPIPTPSVVDFTEPVDTTDCSCAKYSQSPHITAAPNQSGIFF